MDVSILHVSDLHRHAEDPISNDVLLQSLLHDRDRYTSQGVRPPDLAIVSGDIIQGSTSADAEQDIVRQYAEAHDFLVSLCNAFFNGQRNRVVIVPGNHDVSDFRFRKSLKRLDSAGHNVELRNLFKPGTSLRWDWTSLSFYDITDRAAYLQRFAEFAAFYSRFYGDRRHYSLLPEEQFSLFDFDSLGVVVATFNSCHNNDLLNKVAAIHPSCIASGSAAIRQHRNTLLLPIAVWHHNTEGSPYQNDFLHPDQVQCMLDAGFCLAFHGHQHKPEHLHHTFKYGLADPLPLISAGTLCGPPERHHPRSYNVVELELASRRGLLHVRENASRLGNPIWVASSLQGQERSSFDFRLRKPPPMSTSLPLQHAANHMERGDHAAALGILNRLPLTDAMVRRLTIQCYLELRDHASLAEDFADPTTTAEAIHLLNALYHLNDRPRLAAALQLPFIASTTDASLIELRNKYLARAKP